MEQPGEDEAVAFMVSFVRMLTTLAATGRFLQRGNFVEFGDLKSIWLVKVPQQPWRFRSNVPDLMSPW